MLKIRLSRVGKSNSPIFRLVVAEKSRAVKRENLEILGLYNPTLSSDKFQVNKERVDFWMSKGAQPSLTVHNLLCDFGVLAKNKKIKTIFGKPQKKKEKIADKSGSNAGKSAEVIAEEPKQEPAPEIKEGSAEPEKSDEKDQPEEEKLEPEKK